LEQKNLAVEFFATEHTQSTSFDLKLMLLRFRSFGFRHNNGAKLALEGRSSHFWNKKSCSRIFRNERTQSTPFDLRLMIVAFLVVSVFDEQRRETRPGGRSRHFSNEKSVVEFFTTRIHPIYPKLMFVAFFVFGFDGTTTRNNPRGRL
jgi:hypothetical protein